MAESYSPHDAFIFLQLIPIQDPYSYPPASTYDLSIPFFLIEHQNNAQEIPAKKEEATEVGYIVPQHSNQNQIIISKGGQTKKTKTKKQIHAEVDEDYTPRECGKPQKKTNIKQKQDRNLIPNTVHQLLNFVQQQFKSKYLAQPIFAKLNTNPSYSLARFYNFHRMIKGRVNTYVNEGAMLSITQEGALDYSEYDRDEQTFYCKVSRVMVRHFLRREAVMLTLRSTKVKKGNIPSHLSVQRYLYENMLAFDRWQE